MEEEKKEEKKESFTARCFSCKKDVEIEDALVEKTKNNRTRVHGNCQCGKKVSKFIPNQK